jgi:hypothetical protein
MTAANFAACIQGNAEADGSRIAARENAVRAGAIPTPNMSE